MQLGMTAASGMAWGILPSRFVRGDVGMARAKESPLVERNRWWLTGLIGAVAGSVLTVAATAVLDLSVLSDKMTNALPDLKQTFEKAAADIRTDLHRLEDRQRADLAAHVAEERRLRENLGTDLKAIESQLIALRKGGKQATADDIRHVVANVESVSTTEGALLAGLTDVSGTPKFHTNFTKLKGSAVLNMKAYQARKLSVNESLATLLLAKDGKWEATATGLKVSYDGGFATFAAKPAVAHRDLTRQADAFNSISRAVEILGVSQTDVQEQKLRVPYRPSVGPMPAQDTRAPSAVEKIEAR